VQTIKVQNKWNFVFNVASGCDLDQAELAVVELCKRDDVRQACVRQGEGQTSIIINVDSSKHDQSCPNLGVVRGMFSRFVRELTAS